MAFEIIDIEFTDIRGRKLNFPLGNTGSRVTINVTARCRFSIGVTQTLQLKKTGDKYTLTGQNPQGGPLTWESLGFVSGEDVVGTLFWNDGIAGRTAVFNNVIDFTNGADCYFIGSPVFSGPDANPSDVSFLSGQIVMFQNPQGFDFYINAASSENPTSIYSTIDGEPTRFSVDNINTLEPMGPFVSMQQLGNKSGSGYTSILVKKIQDVSGDGTSIYEFQISFVYPHYVNADTFLQDKTVSPFFRVKALTQFNNPNAFQQLQYAPEGNIGWFDENFNGGANSFQPHSIQWTDTSDNQIPAMSFQGQSKFTIIIPGFSGNPKTNIGWFWKPSSTNDFHEKTTDLDTNLITAAGSTAFVIGGPHSFTGFEHPSGARLQIFNINFSVIAGNLQITGVTNPNPAFSAFFQTRQGDRAYGFWVDCDKSDYLTDWNSSTGVNVLVDESQMVEVVEPLGPWEDVDSSVFLDHNSDPLTSFACTEDDLTAIIRFRLPKNTPIQGVIASIIATNGTDSFVLENQAFTLSGLPFISGVLPVNISIDRAYNLPQECDARYIKLHRDESLDNSGSYGVALKYGFLCRWEYWLELVTASDAFYNSKNKNWFHYQSGGWSIKFVMNIVTEEGVYQNGYPFLIKDYDDYIGTSVVEFTTLSGSALNLPSETGLSIVKVSHSLNSPYAWVNPFWGNIRVQPFEGAPHWLLSSRNFTLNPANPLRPLPGQTAVLIEQTSDTTLITRCIFDPTKINSSKVSFSGRINGDSIPKDDDHYAYDDDETVTDDDDNELTNL